MSSLSTIYQQTPLPQQDCWYVYRYRRYSKSLQQLADILTTEKGLSVFLPAPTITSYFFARTTKENARNLCASMSMYPWRKSFGDYVTIPDTQMHYFIRAVESKQRNLTLADTCDIDLQKDDLVRIINGPMEGATGYLKVTPRSKSAKIIIVLDGAGQEATSRPPQSSLSISLDVDKSDVQVLRYANNDHLQTLNKRIRPVIDDALARHREGELIHPRVVQRLQAYVNTISAAHLTTRHQREVVAENLRNIETLIGK